MSRETMQQEPVLWMCHDCGGANQLCPHGHKDAPLYTAPPTREWIGLTDEECIKSLPRMPYEYEFNVQALLEYTKNVEAKLKEKNT